MGYINANLDSGNSISVDTSSKLQHGILDKKFDHFKGLSMALLGAILWGVSGSAAQVLFQRYGFDTGWLVTMRMVVSGLLLLSGVAFKSGVKSVLSVFQRKLDIVSIFLIGVIGLLGDQYSYFKAIQYGNAATATLLQYTGPIFLIVYVALRRRQAPTRVQLVAVLLVFVGIFLLVTGGHVGKFAVSPAAVVWGLVSAITASYYTISSGKLLHRYGAGTTAGWGMLIGGIAMSFHNPPWHVTGHQTIGTWWLVTFVVVFGTLIAFYVYIASLKFISASQASILTCGEPLSAWVIALAFLHLHMSWTEMVGSLCIVVTVTLLAKEPL